MTTGLARGQNRMMRRKRSCPMSSLHSVSFIRCGGLAVGLLAVGASSAWAEEPAASSAPRGFLDVVFAGGPVGIAIMLVLFGLSLTAVYLIIEQLLTLRRKELMPDGVADQVRAAIGKRKIAEATQLCKSKPSLLSFVLLNGLSELDGGWREVEKALEDATAEQAARLMRRIEYLSVIGNIAPMVGLLGTVTGMIMAFQKVATTQGAAGAPELAEGIYQALVTTVGGLVVAIPSLAAFAVFRNRLDQYVAEAAFLAQHVFASLKRRKRPVRSESPQPPPRRTGGSG